jgi:hypothetical protein
VGYLRLGHDGVGYLRLLLARFTSEIGDKA